MTENDIVYIKKVIQSGLVQSPCLEIGVGYGGSTRALTQGAGCTYYGADKTPGAGVDFVVNFEERLERIRPIFEPVGLFGSVLLLNVLEHTFDPVHVLDNVLAVMKPGGTLIAITPTVWPIHNCPQDLWRINPDFYDEYCRRRSLTLMPECFEFVGHQNVTVDRLADGTYQLPLATEQTVWKAYSCLVHRVFSTFGRGMSFPSHVAVGVVIRKTPDKSIPMKP